MTTPRLKPSTKKVLAALQQGGWWTDYQLIEATHATQAGRRLRELRAAGYIIERERIPGKRNGLSRYRLILSDPPQPSPELFLKQQVMDLQLAGALRGWGPD